jgi:phosphate transport system protein
MMREHFIRELQLLNSELIEMGAMIESSISKAVDALIKKDAQLAKEAIDFDEQIDNKEKSIETHCLALLLQQQPMASDLRLVSSAIKMITDMERIGDHASDISEITLLIYDTDYTLHMSKIPKSRRLPSKWSRQHRRLCREGQGACKTRSGIRRYCRRSVHDDQVRPD